MDHIKSGSTDAERRAHHRHYVLTRKEAGGEKSHSERLRKRKPISGLHPESAHEWTPALQASGGRVHWFKNLRQRAAPAAPLSSTPQQVPPGHRSPWPSPCREPAGWACSLAQALLLWDVGRAHRDHTGERPAGRSRLSESSIRPQEAQMPLGANFPMTFPDVEGGDTAGLRHHRLLSPPPDPPHQALLGTGTMPGPLAVSTAPQGCGTTGRPCSPRASQTLLPSQPQGNSLEEQSAWPPRQGQLPRTPHSLRAQHRVPPCSPRQRAALIPALSLTHGGAPRLPGPFLQPPGPTQSPPPGSFRLCCPPWSHAPLIGGGSAWCLLPPPSPPGPPAPQKC